MDSYFEYWMQSDSDKPVQPTIVINETAWKAMKVADPIVWKSIKNLVDGP